MQSVTIGERFLADVARSPVFVSKKITQMDLAVSLRMAMKNITIGEQFPAGVARAPLVRRLLFPLAARASIQGGEACP